MSWLGWVYLEIENRSPKLDQGIWVELSITEDHKLYPSISQMGVGFFICIKNIDSMILLQI